MTLQPVEQLRVDAAIIFADILLPLEPMGIELEFAKDEGPVFRHPIREMKQIEKLRIIEPEEDLPFLMEAIRIVRRELDGQDPSHRILRGSLYPRQLHHRGRPFKKLHPHQRDDVSEPLRHGIV